MDALLAGDLATLGTHGRFLEAIARRIVTERPSGDRALLERRLEQALVTLKGSPSGPATPQDGCSK